MPSARIVVAVLCTRRPGKQHHIGYHGNSRAENETILHASLRECKQVGGLTRLMCSRYVGQRPNCSTIDPPSERAMPAAAAVSREARCSAACILVVHGADHADQPVSSAAETLLSNRACRDEVRYVLHCTALSVLYGSIINNQPSSFPACVRMRLPGCIAVTQHACASAKSRHRCTHRWHGVCQNHYFASAPPRSLYDHSHMTIEALGD